MPTHLHAVLWPEDGVNLSNVMRDFKRFTSRRISKEASRLAETVLDWRYSSARAYYLGEETYPPTDLLITG